MILARKRRRRMRDRKCQSQVLLSSSEDEDAADMMSARRRGASRERLSKRKPTSAEPGTPSARSGKQTSGPGQISSQPGTTSRSVSNSHGHPHRNLECSNLASHGLSARTTTNSYINTPSKSTASSSHEKLEKKPWEIGLLNMKTSSSSSFVPKWRKDISASTPSLAGNSLGPGRETVV